MAEIPKPKKKLKSRKTPGQDSGHQKVEQTETKPAEPKPTLKKKKVLKKAKKKQELELDAENTLDVPPQPKLALKKKKKKKGLKKAEKTQEPGLDSGEASDAGKKRKSNSDAVPETSNARKKQKASLDGDAAPASGQGGGNHLKVYVGGIPFSTDEDSVRDFFADCGDIRTVNLLRDEGGRLKGIGFITFKTEEAVAKALEVDGSNYEGRTLEVAMADKKKKNKQGKGGKGDKSDKGKGRGKSKGSKGKGKGKGNDKGSKGTPRIPMGEKPENCTSIIVKSLPQSVKEDFLRKFFQNCGQSGPTNVNIITSSAGKRVAFVDFGNTEAVDEAMALDGTDLKGKPAFLGYSWPKARKTRKT